VHQLVIKEGSILPSYLGCKCIPPKHRYPATNLHGVIAQKTTIGKFAVRFEINLTGYTNETLWCWSYRMYYTDYIPTRCIVAQQALDVRGDMLNELC